jgi:hypothetical protein
MNSLRRWMLVGVTAVLMVAPMARADLAAPPPVSVQVVVTPGGGGPAAAGDGGAAQSGPVNVNVQVVIDSPGAVTGPVAQSNSATGGMAAPATPPTPPTPHAPAMPVIQASSAPPTPATPATPATPSTPATPAAPVPATPATPAAVPSSEPLAIGAPPQPAVVAPELVPPPAARHHRPARAHRTAPVGPATYVAATGAPARPLITSAPRPASAHHAAPPARAHRPRHPQARLPVAPPAHRLTDVTQAGTASGDGGAALFLALVLALLLAGPAGPGELIAALRRRARAAVGGRLEHPG